MPESDPLSRDRRPYRSTVRAERARETRRRVVSAAGLLFVEGGYAATTLASVARAADVSVDTVYKTFGTKIGLLRQVLDDVVGGDDEPVALLDRDGPQAVRAETDQRVQVRLLAAGVTGQLERLRPLDDVLRGAAAVDPEAAALRADVQVRQRRTAMRTLVGWIAERGPLRDDQSADRAADVVWTLTSPEVHAMLRGTLGWSTEDYRDWLDQALADAVLEPPTGA